MSAYATALRQSSSPTPLAPTGSFDRLFAERSDASQSAVVDNLITAIAERIADAVAARFAQAPGDVVPEWLDSRGAADYLGLHPDTVRKLAAERAIPAEQDAPGCKLFFLRHDLDEWRRAGGRAAHLSSAIAA
jgi:excisionase family DNA binding protein